MYGAYIMQRTQIYLSEAVRQGLLQQQQPQGSLARLRQARGLWAECTDLPDWSALRGELDRSALALEP
jgi:hypothetical protein